jgi:hypothetical protein
MQPKNLTARADYWYIPQTVSATKQNVTQVNRTGNTHVVTCGPIVNGNHKDPNNWYYTVVNRSTWRGLILEDYLFGGWSYKHYGNVTSGLAPDAPAWDKSTVYNAALEKLNAKARGELDLGVALAEAGATYRMVKSLKKVTDFAKRPLLGDPRDLANGWLQWQYGWKPLVGDVFRAADESIRVVLNKLEKLRVRATIPIMVNGTTTREIISSSFKPIVVAEGKGKTSCTICVTYEVPSFDPARWSSLNPISLGWELIPYSFVVDWFYDIGSWLRAMETGLLYGSAFKHGYVSELYVYDAKETV